MEDFMYSLMKLVGFLVPYDSLAIDDEDSDADERRKLPADELPRTPREGRERAE